MRHMKSGRKLGRNSSHRKAMYRNMVTSLFEHGKICTTDAKAKELRPIAEKLITLGKRGDLASRRRALAYVRNAGVVAKLFEEISKQFLTRSGGYTRIIKLENRRGDNAPVSVIELVEGPPAEEAKPKKTRAKKAKPTAPKAQEAEETKEGEAPQA